MNPWPSRGSQKVNSEMTIRWAPNFFSIEAMRAMSGGEQVGQMPKSTGAAIVLAKAAHTRREASSKSRCEQGLLTHCSVNRFLS